MNDRFSGLCTVYNYACQGLFMTLPEKAGDRLRFTRIMPTFEMPRHARGSASLSKRGGWRRKAKMGRAEIDLRIKIRSGLRGQEGQRSGFVGQFLEDGRILLDAVLVFLEVFSIGFGFSFPYDGGPFPV